MRTDLAVYSRTDRFSYADAEEYFSADLKIKCNSSREIYISVVAFDRECRIKICLCTDACTDNKRYCTDYYVCFKSVFEFKLYQDLSAEYYSAAPYALCKSLLRIVAC